MARGERSPDVNVVPVHEIDATVRRECLVEQPGHHHPIDQEVLVDEGASLGKGVKERVEIRGRRRFAAPIAGGKVVREQPRRHEERGRRDDRGGPPSPDDRNPALERFHHSSGLLGADRRSSHSTSNAGIRKTGVSTTE